MKLKFSLAFIGILAVLNVFAWQEIFILSSHNYVRVAVLDIGQGDSIFIETPSMRHILIDGGPDSKVLEKLQKFIPFWHRSLDVVVLTHPDADHVTGLLYALQKYRVGYIVWTGIVREGGNYQKWTELLSASEKKGTKVIKAQLNQKIVNGDVAIDILHPFEDLTGRIFGKQGNDTGIVSRLLFGKNSFLFTADISSNVEEQMIDKKIDMASDVLKIGHHGSKYSTSEAFLKAVNPKIAVISVGKKNPYGHPTSEVLQKLQNFGIKIFRTDQNGTIEMLSDGENIKIE
ncbi:MAG: hypothetical protein A3A98_04290 [Candidatus Staskawiczbacteria bacterium RIFCSPLOWO2_01_FULL_40_39]|uniref:Metallo-beta-lactamase domain-containing protein n=1 Tax=Candidatus Staskawiczbacteria bacterium RIFCSPHIGHO2_01_FULL_39_25 TaxID=1802202 RepID=A0A1G2HPK1_9BACT|nr:MAG: hypothetical protein A2730_03505 [Candidatus Staskawiczbacteria bacterium RIFCSPHIGHO2_01_FULL_39_25]OGZ73987.1 MAG: hypothetical protein A3A98_04290 [Candidatus Staskawiczbacteria bacterium RIFCSPLOWO2_01_FULL_40_39]OGZ76427.1 MAG: hypothetical protein A3I87_02335 [Candidatus Staskawiczbacteria bacterium RIFCSPLOWO2_02_FULL_39_8]